MTIALQVVVRPSLDETAIAHLLDLRGLTWRRDALATEADELIELAGRVCYLSFGENQSPRTNSQYIKNLIGQGHESVLEHASWTFVLSGVTRSFTHQLVRHRVGFSYSQLSQQYVDHENWEFIPPPEIERTSRAFEVWRRAIETTSAAYRELRQELQKSEAFPRMSTKERRRAAASGARSVLPNSTATVIVVTANARSLRHFLKLRGAIEGDREMREVCARLVEVLKVDAPSCFQDFSFERLSDGSPIVRHSPL